MSERPSDPANHPLLYFKVSALGSTPHDFPYVLEREFEIMRISGDDLRDEIREERGLVGARAKISDREIRRRVIAGATPALLGGEDVFADIAYNSPSSRNRTPIRLARETGALTVAFSIETPLDLIEHRVRRRIRNDSLGIPLREWHISPLSAARNAYDNLIRPQPGEELDYVFTLDGSQDSEGLIDQIEAYLDSHELLFEES